MQHQIIPAFTKESHAVHMVYVRIRSLEAYFPEKYTVARYKHV